MLNVIMLSRIMLSRIMLSLIMLSVVMLNVIMLNVVMLSVLAPYFCLLLSVSAHSPLFVSFYVILFSYVCPLLSFYFPNLSIFAYM
jgi:hypothetical protein